MPGGPGGRGGRGGRFGGIGGFFGFGPPARPGEILPAIMQDTLQLSGDQKKELESLQKSTDEKLDKLLTDEQRRQLKEMRDNLAGGGLGGFAGGPNGGPQGNGRPQNGGPPGGGNQNGGPGGPQMAPVVKVASSAAFPADLDSVVPAVVDPAGNRSSAVIDTRQVIRD